MLWSEKHERVPGGNHVLQGERVGGDYHSSLKGRAWQTQSARPIGRTFPPEDRSTDFGRETAEVAPPGDREGRRPADVWRVFYFFGEKGTVLLEFTRDHL